MGAGVDFVVHGPPGSAPPVMADALLAALREIGGDGRDWRLVPRGDDPGVDAMNWLVMRPRDENILSTCTPVFLQAPLLRGMALTHRKLTPIARLVTDQYFLVARADAPWRDAHEFVRNLKERPTRTGGYFRGGINHLLALAIAEKAYAPVEFVITPSEPAVWNGLIEGGLDWGCGVAAEILPHVEAGTLRVLAALHETRLSPFAEAPTLREAGADVTFKLWRGLMGPPDLSAEALERWRLLVERLRETAAWRAYLERNAQRDGYLPPAEFTAFLETEWDWYAEHLGMAGLLQERAAS